MDARGFPWPDNSSLKYISPLDATQGWACWILEQFVEPSFFGDADEWERNRWSWEKGQRVEVMAPYPSRGEYVFVQQLATPEGEPFPLTESVLDYVSWMMRNLHSRPHNGYTQQQLIAERMKAIREERERRQKEVDAALEVQYDEAATRADQVNVGMTREWSKPSPSMMKTAKRLIKGANE